MSIVRTDPFTFKEILKKRDRDESDFQLRIVVHPTVLDRLRTEDEKHLIEMEKRYFGKLSFRADTGMHAVNGSVLTIDTLAFIFVFREPSKAFYAPLQSCQFEMIHAPWMRHLDSFGGTRFRSIPQAVGKPVSFKIVSATRTAAGGVPDFNPVKTGHRTDQFHLRPAPRLGRSRNAPSGCEDAPRIVHQPKWRNDNTGGQQTAAGPVPGARGRRFLFAIAQPEAGEHVEKPAAIETDDGLHGAVDAGVGAAGNARLILAMRTVEMIRPAHVLEIQLWLPPGNPALPG